MKYLKFKYKKSLIQGVMTIDSKETLEKLQKEYKDYELKIMSKNG